MGIALTGPIWGPGGGGPTFPPGSFFAIISPERAVQVGDTLRLALLDGGTAVWSSSDTSIATAFGDGIQGSVVGRAAGSVVVTVQSQGRALTRRIDVVQSLCQRQVATRVVVPGTDTTVTLDASDCAIGYAEGLQWPVDTAGPAHPSVRAEHLRIDLSDSTLLRIDAASTSMRPLLVIADSAGRPIAGRLNYWTDVYVARLLPPGRYNVWIGSDVHRPTGDIRVQLRAVTRCSDASVLPRPLTLGTWHSDTLDASSCHSDAGEAQQPWTVSLFTPGWYRTIIESTLTNEYIVPYVHYEGSALDRYAVSWRAGSHTLFAANAVDGPYRIRMVACPTYETCPP